MTEQLELSFDADRAWDDDRRLLRQMAEAIGLKTCSIDLDVSPSQLAHALDERDRNLPAKWLRYLCRHAPIDMVREYGARLFGQRRLRVVDAPPMTPTEELAALKDALSSCLGPEMRQVVLSKAFGPGTGEPAGRSRR